MLDFLNVQASSVYVSQKGSHFQYEDLPDISEDSSGKSKSKKVTRVYPEFKVIRSKDLMIRGRDFYALWDDENGVWVNDEYDAVTILDNQIREWYQEHKDKLTKPTTIDYLVQSRSGAIDVWHKYVQHQCRDNYHELNSKIIFADDEYRKEDYATKRLPYSLKEMETPGYDRFMTTVFSAEEREKLEWAIGSILSGASKSIQKFIVLYGGPGTGKSTFLRIVEKLFDGYYAYFDAAALANKNDQFALESFHDNPLVAIQHDGDLSRISDNTRINSIVSHETMVINEKFKAKFSTKFHTFLFLGTNSPVFITGSKSGINRRLIDVRPTGNTLSSAQYEKSISKIDFELGGIAQHCLDVFNKLGPHYYDNYTPTDMRSETDDFYNFVSEYGEHTFKTKDETTLTEAWTLYKKYVEFADIKYPYSYKKVKAELKDYFLSYKERGVNNNGERVRNLYSGFILNKFTRDSSESDDEEDDSWLDLTVNSSVFDIVAKDYPAQYASENETPQKKWDSVDTTLKDILTSQLHYVKVPENHIVIDFDLKNDSGEKDFELNREAAKRFPKTYAEVSKGGQGIHLHYIYDGDVSTLSRIFDDGIEIKVFSGNSSLRRKLTLCNTLPIAIISSGLPLKEEKMVSFNILANEQAIRTIIKKNLRKEYHSSTKSSVDFIKATLDKAYASGMTYDVSDLKEAVSIFASKSTHQADTCMKLVKQMKFKSDETEKDISTDVYSDDKLVFFDIEVFPNLFLVNWKQEGKDKIMVRMINPRPEDIAKLCKYRLVGFNCRRYDNHILYARMMGYSLDQLYKLSKKIISGDRNAMFGEAYNISYTDVYDFSSDKKSLKKFEIELGIHHQELGLDWDQPVPEDMWDKVSAYCDNDVIATEAVFNARHADFVAREILADIAGMPVNSSTNSLTTRIIFGKNKRPGLVYTDLDTGIQHFPDGSTAPSKNLNAFPGYSKEFGKNMYRGVDIGFGGLVWAQPGMYSRAVTFDVASMHPNSAIQLGYFGEYTKNFEELVQARIYIKHKEYEKAGEMFDGKLKPYLKNKEDAKALAHALKIAINSVYGLTSASFINSFNDNFAPGITNSNNIVALRGALFMKTLMDEVVARGGQVIHIKTDSIKVLDPSKELTDFIFDFGKKYGYTFEVEHIWDKICLINNSVYVGKHSEDDENDPGKWEAVGKQFQVPYIFKTLFTHEKIEFEDMCETKSVQTSIFLDMNEGYPEGEHNLHFVGKVGSFCPIKSGKGGGILLREKDGSYDAVNGSKGYRWLESETVKQLKKVDDIDKDYYISLTNDAIEALSKYGDYDWFVS